MTSSNNGPIVASYGCDEFKIPSRGPQSTARTNELARTTSRLSSAAWRLRIALGGMIMSLDAVSAGVDLCMW